MVRAPALGPAIGTHRFARIFFPYFPEIMYGIAMEQGELFIPGPERDMDLAVFDGFDVPSFLRNHEGVPAVAATKEKIVHDRLETIQRAMIENDPAVQQILAGIVHARSAAASRR